MKKTNYARAFTLTELMVVIIIIGLLAAFGIPNYQRSLDKAKEKDAFYNLEVIKEAVRMYISRTNNTFPPALANTAAINATLNVQVIENSGTTYNCGPAGTSYFCTAVQTDWTLKFQLDNNQGDVFCVQPPANACPACDNNSCPY